MFADIKHSTGNKLFSFYSDFVFDASAHNSSPAISTKAEDLPNIRDALVVSRLAGDPARQSGLFNIRPFRI